MRYWTWEEIKEKIEAECDLQGEVFVGADELLGYANEAIDEAESQIHTLYEDYFLRYTPITLVNGTSSYDLPSTIYANKIRKVIYKNGQDVYEVRRLRDRRKVLSYAVNRASSSSGVYEYLITNETAGSPKIIFTPDVIHSGEFIEIWHIRNANRLTVSADVCDIPEFISFIFKYMKVKVYDKEGHPHLMIAQADLEKSRQDMVSTLAGMVVDDENEIEADFSFYNEMS